MNIFDKARERVENTPVLTAYRDTILYDWPEGNSHWAWVATAPVDEIVDWASMVESMERELELTDEPEPSIDIDEHNAVLTEMMASILSK